MNTGKQIQYHHEPESETVQESSCCRISGRVKAYKNLFGLCISFICCFGAFLGILNLQSSINSSGGLGLAANSTLYGVFVLCAIFFPLYVRVVGNKLALISGYFGFLVYSCCNYYPSWYTLIPGSVVLGVCTGPVWVGMYSHSTLTAVKFSSALNEEPKNAIALFNGWIAAATKLSRVSGSLISSIVLVAISEPNNATIVDTANASSTACNNTQAQSLEKHLFLYYILVSVYVACGVAGIVIAMLTIDRFETERMNERIRQERYSRLLRVPKVLFTPSMLLLFPLCIMDGQLLGFSGGTFPEVGNNTYNLLQ